MSAPAAATRAAKSATNASRGAENSLEMVLVELPGGNAASTDLERHFASRCADLP
jgi:hypothetical protein